MYSQLKEELADTKQELADFIEEYPQLFITKIIPEDIVSQVFRSAYNQYNEDRVRRISYLDPEERDYVEIGNIPHPSAAFRSQKTIDHIDDEIGYLKADILQLLDDYTLRIKGLYLKMSHFSAKNTAELMDTQYTLELNVQKAETALADYYINICATPSVAKRLPFSFHMTKDTLPAKPGLYFICSEGDVVYVGHSIDINRRVRNHEVGPTYYCGKLLECVTSELDIETAKKLEAEIIYILKPKENTYSK